METIDIPGLIDDPPHILLWNVEELVPVMVGLMCGMVVEQALIGTLLGFAVTQLYRRFRDNTPDGYLQHMLGWHGLDMRLANPEKRQNRYFVTPMIRQLVP